MKCTFWLAIGISFILVLDGCSRAQNAASAQWDEAKARDTALSLAKGWKFSPDDFQGNSVADLRPNVYAVLPFDLPRNSRWLLLVATAPPNDTCHACAPITGAVIFAMKDGAWPAVYDQAQVIHLGAFGKPPNARARPLGPSKPAVEFELNSMAQGYEVTSLTFVAEVNHTLQQVLSLDTEASNEAAGMPPNQTFKWQASVETSPSNSGFADITVKYSGTKPADNQQEVRPYSAKSVYRFSGDNYKKVE
jgi:hypothetical protein